MNDVVIGISFSGFRQVTSVASPPVSLIQISVITPAILFLAFQTILPVDVEAQSNSGNEAVKPFPVHIPNRKQSR